MVVDAARMVATPDVERLLNVVTAAIAQVVLMGDPHQHSAVKARSGMLATFAHALPDTVELSEVFQQQNPAERATSRGLSDGDGAGGGQGCGVVHRAWSTLGRAGVNDALEACHTNVRFGWESLLVADSNDTVDALNIVAQQRMADDGVIDPADAGAKAVPRSAFLGYVVCTRRNDYSLTSSTGEPVRNGQRRRVPAISADESAQLHRLDGVSVGGDSGSS